MIESHPQVNKEGFCIRFDKFNVSSFNIFIYFFIDTSQLSEYLKTKENINFNIMDILQQEGVSMALPSTSIYVEGFPNKIQKVNIKLLDTRQNKEASKQNLLN